jgi:hypothetical protein
MSGRIGTAVWDIVEAEDIACGSLVPVALEAHSAGLYDAAYITANRRARAQARPHPPPAAVN